MSRVLRYDETSRARTRADRRKNFKENAAMFSLHTRLGLGLTAAVLASLGALLASSASAETIAVIGTGRVAGALGPRFAELGHRIVYGSREPDRPEVTELVAQSGDGASVMMPAQAVRDADIVVLAVPWAAAETVLKSLGDLSGKIVLDPTNAVREGPDGLREHAVETSAGELIQGWAPGARVVKAFNTLNYRTMIDPASAGGPVTIPIVGNDPEAKAVVAGLAEGIGFETMDLGPIRYAHVLEGMLVIWSNARAAGTPFNYYFRPGPAN